MKKFSSEFAHDYGSYSFGYANYVKREEEDDLADLYSLGYLPYSGSAEARNVFYMARSARVVLPEFSFTSENKRVAKKFDGEFEKERVPFRYFPADSAFLDFFSGYFSTRHGSHVMPKERIEAIFGAALITDIIVYKKEGNAVAYVLEVQDGTMAHFWYSAYDLSYANQSLGMWLMLDCLRDAREAGKKEYYVGTVYEEKALYKTNLAPLEFWNGSAWVRDVRKLKERSRSDERRVHQGLDEWKEGFRFF